MLILGIETATAVSGCALGGPDGVIARVSVARGRRHAELLVPQVRTLCEMADVELSEVRVVAVDVGPGLFTGLRVGLATAKGLAYALGVPMIGLPSLDLLAFPFRHSPRTVVVAIDARRGELYHAAYRTVPGGLQRIGPHSIGLPEALAADLMAGGEEVLLAGDGARRYREHFEDLAHVELVDDGDGHPSAASLVALAHAAAVREEFRRPDEVQPIYLRVPDAEINWTTRHSS